MRSTAAVHTFATLSCLAACSSQSTAPPSPSKPEPAPAAVAADQQPSAALQTAMTAFTQALRDSNTQVILSMFSATQNWNVINTRSPVHMPTVVSHARLAEALEKQGPLQESLLGAQSNSLRAYVSGEHAAAWTARGPYQFAPQSVSPGLVWVAWRLEGDRWVIDTLAWPVN